MTRSLNWFNFAGVLTLTVLCCAQWRINRQLNLKAEDLERTRLTQSAKIADQEKSLQAAATDLQDFRQRLSLSESAVKESEDKFATLAAAHAQLFAERAQLKSDLEKWTAAVTARDAQLTQAAAQLQSLTTARNDAIQKFNDLAEKYNALVKDVEKSRAKQ